MRTIPLPVTPESALALPFDSWSPRAQALARPFAESAWRLLELGPEAGLGAAQERAAAIEAQHRVGRDVARLNALGPASRTPAAVAGALEVFRDPQLRRQHLAFTPWLHALPFDARALPNALQALDAAFRQRVQPVEVLRRLAGRLLPELAAEPEGPSLPPPPTADGPRFFGGDLELAIELGPPLLPEARASRAGLLDNLARAPGALTDALLSGARMLGGKTLHTAYLKSLLAAADGGEPSALRRLSEVGNLWQEVEQEPAGPFVLAWRAFLLESVEAFDAQLERALASELTPLERDWLNLLDLRLVAAEDADEAWERLQPFESADASIVRGFVALQRGEVEVAHAALLRGWEVAEWRPRLAPALAFTSAVLGEDAAARTLLSRPGLDEDSALTQQARGWLAWKAGDLDAALGHHAFVGLPDHFGRAWAIAHLSEEPAERLEARAVLWPLVEDDPSLFEPLARSALLDGALEELDEALVWTEGDEALRSLRVALLDHVGRRAEAWSLRGADEGQLRDEARSFLAAHRPLEAVRALAGLPLADPLRRRAARAAVLAELARAEEEVDASAVVRRVLGRVSAEESALLDLPTSLYEAAGALQQGDATAAIEALRRHLDGHDDPRAARFLEALLAPTEDGARLEAALASVVDASLVQLIDGAVPEADDLWSAAVLIAALRGRPHPVAPFDGGESELLEAATLLRLRAALAATDWKGCAESLEALLAGGAGALSPVVEARDAVAMARLAECWDTDVEASALALEAAVRRERSPRNLHDRAVWRHGRAIALDRTLSPRELAEVVRGWQDALDAGGELLAGDADGAARARLEDVLLGALVGLAGRLDAEADPAATRAQFEAQGSLGAQLVGRLGWRSATS